ncbi:MAG: hypothetical protein JXB85_12585 [Anaerolineales bacterium]|nr:hypothetical protein [Anaerolineales bacterium]
MKKGHADFYYITGCDGTGKSTHAQMLVDALRQQGHHVHHVWLRFPFLFSTPFLLYARLRKTSWHEVHDGRRYGYWNFRSSWIMRTFFPWVLLVDAFLAACWRIYLPLALGRKVVCERFALDMLVDLSLACKDERFFQSYPGRWFARLIPARNRTLILDVDLPLIRERRPALIWDHMLEERLGAYRGLAAVLKTPVIENRSSIGQVHDQILMHFGLDNDTQ